MVERAPISIDSSFEVHLVAMKPAIALTAECHRLYPVLHYFHSKDPHAALATSIAKLALLLHTDRSKMPKVDKTVVQPLAHNIHNLLDALCIMGSKNFALSTDKINNSDLEKVNINPRQPLPSTRLPDIEWLKTYVLFDGWDWEAIEEGGEDAFHYIRNSDDKDLESLDY